jgi:hypothetical protein
VVSAQLPPRTPQRGTPATSCVPVLERALPRLFGVLAVIGAVISPVIPPALRSGNHQADEAPAGPPPLRRPLPLAVLLTRRTATTVYGLSALDDRGRLADRTVMRALGWSAGLRLDIREAAGLLVIRSHADGELQVTGQGHLRLPALLRHRCGLEAGDRVLLAAFPGQSQLLVYPPAVLDALIAEHHHADPMAGASS